jgi:mRNA interferase MazF
MTTSPGEVYKVDLGIAGKVRSMVVVSREDPNVPRALAVCAPVTTAYREPHPRCVIQRRMTD